MEELLRFLELYEVWIYILLGAVAFIYLRKVFLAWQEWRVATFGLERETAVRRFGSALTVVILLVALGAAEFLLVSFVSPSLPRSSQLPTPTLDLLATQTPTLPALSSETAVPLDGNATQAPAAMAASSGGCIPGQIEWIYPEFGGELNGTVELKGTVNIPNLGFYKYEYKPFGSDNWVTIAAGNQAIVDKSLGGVWNTAELPAGDYSLRLVVIDSQNQSLPPCEISVQITSP